MKGIFRSRKTKSGRLEIFSRIFMRVFSRVQSTVSGMGADNEDNADEKIAVIRIVFSQYNLLMSL